MTSKGQVEYRQKAKFVQISTGDTDGKNEPDALTLMQLFTVLRPFFWPYGGTDGYFLNRVRAVSTYLMITASKVCSVLAPFQLITATNALVDGKYDAAREAIIIFATLRFATSFFKEGQAAMYLKVKQQATIELAELVYAHVHGLSLHWHLSKKTGNTIRVIDRGYEAADRLVTWLFLNLVPALSECLAVVLVFLFNYSSPSLSMTVLGGVLLYAGSTVMVTKYRAKLKGKANKSDNSFHEISTDALLNYETVKTFTNEPYEIMRYIKAVTRYQMLNLKIMFSLNGLNATQNLIMTTTLGAVMVIGARQVVDGDISVGDWVAIYSWVITIFQPLFFLGTIYQVMVQAFVDIKNLSELLSTEPDLEDVKGAVDMLSKNIPSTSSSTVSTEVASPDGVDIEMGNSNKPTPKSKGVSVQFKDVFFHYPSQDPGHGLQGVTFDVPPGTTTAVVGPTGAGKTTISRLLLRFYDPKAGTVLLNGVDISRATQKSVRGNVGVVPQDIVLFNDTILHNIQYGKLDASFESVQEAARAASLLDFIEGLPDKWETQVGERGLKLSGGEKQRVGIARCLLKDPPVVLLDEATSALDTVTENSIQEALNALGQNRTVVVIAHRLSTIADADQIIVLKDGCVAERGTHDTLLRSDGVYSRLWAMQTKASNQNLDELDIDGAPSV